MKEFNELTLNDKRNDFWLLDNPETQMQSTIPLKDWHQQVKSINLSDKVPETIRSEFNIARNLATYSWFCHSFHEVCKTKAFSILEYALAVKYNHGIKIDDKRELKLLLEMAVKQGGFNGSDIFLKELPNLINNLRYSIDLANETLYKNSWFTLKLCSDLINQIFENNEYSFNN